MPFARAVLTLALSAAAAAAEEKAVADPLVGFGWLRDLAGSCWTAVLPGGTLRDTQCYEVRMGRFLHGAIRLEDAATARAAGPAVKLPHGSGFEGANVCKAADGRISCWLWASDGTFGPSEAMLDGDLVRYPHAPKPGSTAAEQRSTWKRLSPDSFQVTRERKDPDGWKELFAVTYTRARP